MPSKMNLIPKLNVKTIASWWIDLIVELSFPLSNTLRTVYDTISEPVDPCQRECDDGPARRCVYDFHVEYYFTMSKACFDCPHRREDCDRHHCIPADGVERGVISINRQIPGPSIQVKPHPKKLSCLGHMKPNFK